MKARVLLCAAAVLVGCSPGGDRSDVVTRDTTVTHRGAQVPVQIVENSTDAESLTVWTVSEPMLNLGGPDAPADAALFRVGGAYRLADGRVVVADGGSTHLKIFNSDGTLAGTTGGPGDGPGEFRRLDYFGLLPGDSLAVWDLGLARMTVFAPDGTRARELRIGATPASPRSSVSGLFSDGSILSRGFVNLGTRRPEGRERHEAELYHLARDGTLADSLGSFPGSEAFFISFERGFSVFEAPLGRTTEIMAAGDRLYIADSERAEIRKLMPDGTPVRLIRWTQPARTVTASDVDRAREQHLANNSESSRQEMEQVFNDMPIPETMPAFAMLHVDREGNAWVLRYRTPWDEGMSEWLVFGKDGSLIAEAALPPGLEPTDIGSDYILGIERDELDVEHVRLYRFEK